MVKQDSSLLNLPDEILLRILRFLATQDLCQVRLSQSHLNDLAQEYVFERFDLLYGKHAERLAVMLRHDQKRAQWIKRLLISPKFDEDQGLGRLPDQMVKMNNLLDLVLETPDCNNRPPADRIKWVKLQDQYEWIFRQSTIAVPETERLLPQLRTCTLHFVDEDIPLYPLTKYSCIFLHPNLKSLTLSCACTDTPDRLLKDFRQYQCSTSLEHLHLEECDFDPKSLEILLKFPKALKSLKLSEGIRYSDMSRRQSRLHGNLVPGRLSRALANTVSMSLEHLSLKLGYTADEGTHSWSRAGRSLDLTSLTNLKFLEVSLSTLATIKPYNTCNHTFENSLPASLEHIRVFNMPPSLQGGPPIPLKTCLLENKQGHGLPNLKQITQCYEYQAPRGNASTALFRADMYATYNRLIEDAMARVQTRNNKHYPMYKESNTRVVIECEVTPPGYIPPYLRNEESPELKVIWDSHQPTLEALIQEDQHQQAKERVVRNSVASEHTDNLLSQNDTINTGQAVIGVAHGNDEDDDNDDDDLVGMSPSAAELLHFFNLVQAADHI